MSDVAFYDVPADAFPFTIEFLRGDEVVHRIRVEGPGAVSVPPLRKQLGLGDGERIDVRIVS